MSNIVRFPYRIDAPIYSASLTNYDSSFIKPANIKILSVDEDEIYAELQAKGNTSSLQGLFREMSGLTSLDLTSWDTQGYTTFAYMFQDCSNLTLLDLSGLTLNGILKQTFFGCQSLTSIGLTGVSATLSKMDNTFSQCFRLTSLTVAGWDVSTCDDFYGTFQDCRALTELDLTGWDTHNATDMGSMFESCTSLRKIWVPATFTANNVSSAFEKPFAVGTGRSGGTHVYTNASDASSQGWGTIHSDFTIHYNATHTDYENA